MCFLNHFSASVSTRCAYHLALAPAMDVANSASKRRRLSVKTPAPPHVAHPPSARRRLSVKQSVPSMCSPMPVPPAAVLPLSTSIWSDLDAAAFEDLAHRRRYRMVYNKFEWCFSSDPVCVECDDLYCTEELWRLGRKDYRSLGKQRKKSIMRHFFALYLFIYFVFSYLSFLIVSHSLQAQQPLSLSTLIKTIQSVQQQVLRNALLL